MIRLTARLLHGVYVCEMKQTSTAKKDLYYTSDHEWVDFQGSVAYTGVCGFKLTGFKEIKTILFKHSSGFLKQGDTIAVIKYKEYTIEAHMPVNGKILQVNEELLGENKNVLLQDSESEGWIALIIPSVSYDRGGLILSKHYQMNNKGKYAKG